MKIACISDTHGLFLPEIAPDTDIILHAGDVAPDYNALRWLGPWGGFSTWCYTHNKPVFMTWGNHDFIGQSRTTEVINEYIPDNVRIAVDELVEIPNGPKVWFSPWSNLYGDWAFMEVESELARRHARISPEADIIVSHGPPKGFGDLTDAIYGPPEHVGSTSLLEAFKAHPRANILICGHIHGAAGGYHVDMVDGSVKWVLNVAQVDEEYQPVYNAVRYLDWKPKA